MKRIFAALVALIMILAVSTVTAENEDSDIPFACGLTSSVVPDNALEIISSDTQRALISVCLWLDFGVSDEGKDFMADNLGALCFNDSYVATDGTYVILVAGYASGKQLNIFYKPSMKEASYTLNDVNLPDEYMKTLLKTSSDFFTINYKNDVSDLVQVIEMIKEITSGS